MNIAQEILDYIESDEYLPLRADALIVHLATDDREINAYAKALARLEEEFRLVVTKKGTVLPMQDSNLRRGIFRASTRGFGFADCVGTNGKEETYFIPPSARNHCQHNDVVLIQIDRLPHNGKEGEARVQRILERALTSLVGTVEKKSFYQKRRNRFGNFTLTIAVTTVRKSICAAASRFAKRTR